MGRGGGGAARRIRAGLGFTLAFAAISVLLVGPVSEGGAALQTATGKIAFELGGDIWTIERDGTGLHQLTSGGNDDRDPSWSPTGRHIAFSRDNRIHVMGADGTGITQVTTGSCAPGSSERQGHPDWTYDAQEVLFAVEFPCFEGDPPMLISDDVPPSWIGRTSVFGTSPWQWALSRDAVCPSLTPPFEFPIGMATLPAASPVSGNFVVTSRLVCGGPGGGGALIFDPSRTRVSSIVQSASWESELGLSALSTLVKRPGVPIDVSSPAVRDSVDPTTYYEYGMQAYFPSDPLAATVAFTTKQNGTDGFGNPVRDVFSSALYRGGGAAAQILIKTGDELFPGWCVDNITMPDIPLDGDIIALMHQRSPCTTVFDYDEDRWEHYGWETANFGGSHGILLVDSDGSSPRILNGTSGASGPDVQCVPGSCLTGLRIVQRLSPFPTENQFSYSGDLAGAIGDGQVLFEKTGAGEYTVTQSEVPGHPLLSIECTGQPPSGHTVQKNIADGSVTVQLIEGDLVTCVFENFGQVLDPGGGDDPWSTPATDPVTVTIQAWPILKGSGQVKSVATGAFLCAPANVDSVGTCRFRVQRGSQLAIYAVPQDNSLFDGWFGPCVSTYVLDCAFTASADSTIVQAFFKNKTPPSEYTFQDLLDKANIAQEGADASYQGAINCGAIALLLAGGDIAFAFVFASEEAFLVFEHVFDGFAEQCLTGLAGSIAAGVQLFVDPPDPAYRRVATPPDLALGDSTFDCSGVPKSKSQACKTARALFRRYSDQSERVAELQVVRAAMANRFSAALIDGDLTGAELQRTSLRLYDGLLALADAKRATTGALLRAALKTWGLSRVVVRPQAFNQFAADFASLATVPQSVVQQLIALGIVENEANAREAIVSVQQPVSVHVDLLTFLSKRAPTKGVVAGVARTSVQDVVLLVRALIDESPVSDTLRARLLKDLADATATCSKAQARALLGDAIVAVRAAQKNGVAAFEGDRGALTLEALGAVVISGNGAALCMSG